MRELHNSESGQVMLIAVVIVMMIAMLSISYLSASFQLGQATTFEVEISKARLAAEEGVYLSIAELKSLNDPDGDGLGNLAFQGADDRAITTQVTDLGGNLYRVRATATVNSISQACECIAQLIPPTALNLNARAAITAEGPIVTSGNINVDGRDWDEWGAFVQADGVFGISSMEDVNQAGSSTIGGVGQAPDSPAPLGTVDEFATWNDGADNDGDALVDEELFDGVDNDGDGLVDEDTSDYPITPDVMFGLADGTLRALAQAAGTYFNNQAALEDYIAAHGDNIPGGVIIYADFDTWLPVNLGNQFNDPPSLIVHHNETSSALMKNVHGAFRGMILADFVEHINGDFVLIGAFMSFSDEMIGNAFGNGGADVLYSSTVLGNLPGGAGGWRARVLSWNRTTTN